MSTYHSTFTFNLKLKLFRSIPKNKIAYFELNDCELWKGNMKSCSFALSIPCVFTMAIISYFPFNNNKNDEIRECRLGSR